MYTQQVNFLLPEFSFGKKKNKHKIMSVFTDWPKPQNTEGDVELKNGRNEWKKNLRVVKTK